MRLKRVFFLSGFSGRGLLLSWFRTEVFAAAVLAGFSVFSYLIAAQIVRKQVSEINAGVSFQSRAELDGKLEEIRAVALNAASAPFSSLIELNPGRDPGVIAWAYRELVEFLRINTVAHGYIDKALFVNPACGAVFSADGMEACADVADVIAGGISIEKYVSLLSGEPSYSRHGWLVSEDKRLMYIHLLNVPSGEEAPYFLIRMDRGRQDKLLGQVQSRYGGFQLVCGSDGTVLFSSGGISEVPDDCIGIILEDRDSAYITDKGAFAAAVSSAARLYCVSFIPKERYMRELHIIRSRMLFAGLFCAVVLLLILFYQLRISYFPLRRIIDSFKDSSVVLPSGLNEYEMIESYVGKLSARNMTDRKQLEDFRRMLENHNLDMFIKGFVSFQDLPSRLKDEIRLGRGEFRYILAGIRIRGSELSSDVLSLYLSGLRPEKTEAFSSWSAVRSDGNLFLIIKSGAGTEDPVPEVMDFLERSCRGLEKQSGFKAYAAVSRPFEDVSEIRGNYRMCSTALTESLFFPESPAVIEACNKGRKLSYLDNSDRKALAAAVLDGNCSGALQVINKAIANPGQLRDSGGMDGAVFLAYSIFTVIVQTVHGTPAGGASFAKDANILANRLLSSEDIDSVSRILADAVVLACRLIVSCRNNRSETLYQDILDYVAENINNKDMYLPTISGYFRLSPKYLSSFFKNRNGTGLSEYIRKIRVEKAMEKLKEDVNIGDIAVQTGFSSIISFNRAFRQHTGKTPSEYRRWIRGR